MTEAIPLPKAERRQHVVQLPSGFAQVSYVVYERANARRTLLCLHDFLGNAADFDRVAFMLASHGLRVVCPDLPGRGQSAYLAPAEYNPHTDMLSLVTLLHALAVKRVMVIGKGWGGLLALGLAQLDEVSVSKVVVTDLNLPWKLDIDAATAQAAAGPGFATLDEARRVIANTAEFSGLVPRRALSLIDGRLRQIDGRYGLDFDPALLSAPSTAQFSKVSVTPLFEGVRAEVLVLFAGTLSERDRERIRPIMAASPNRSLAEIATRAKRIHFTSHHEMLLTLGFLLNRFIPS